MPERVSRPFQPSSDLAYEIRSNKGIPSYVGIHGGKGVVAFFRALRKENITFDKITDSGWRYYGIPTGYTIVIFAVTRRERRKPLITIKKFRR